MIVSDDMHFYLISSQNFWTFEVPHVEKGCIPFKPQIYGGSVFSTCVFYFSLCHPVPSLCTENCGICLTNKVSFWGHDYDNKTLSLNFIIFIRLRNQWKLCFLIDIVVISLYLISYFTFS